MAEADWTILASPGLGSGDVARGVSMAFTPPSGGGSFVHGFRSITTTTGVAGYYYNSASFAPITGSKKGGSIRAAMKRYSATLGYAPFIGLIQGNNPNSPGYLLGLNDAATYKVVLNKTTPGAGLAASGSTMLRASADSYTAVGDAATTWFQLRLDVLVNPHGEVILNCYQNDLSLYSVASPTWTAIDGMSSYTDDSLGILSGSLPYLDSFYAVFGFYTNNSAGCVALFDYVEVSRQLTP